MKKLLFSLLSSVTLVSRLAADPIPLYENFGFNDFGNDPPQIDALAFANYGTFQVFTTLPFDFQSTLNFTNRGGMFGNSGFQFDTASSLGARQMANRFYNYPGAQVISSDNGLSILIIQGSGVLVSYFPSYLLATATNVVNSGLLSVGAGGLLQLTGKDVDLTRGGLEVRPIEGIGVIQLDPTNFIPDIGISDIYWGGLTNQFLGVDQLVRFPGGASVIVQTPASLVTNAGGGTFFTSIGIQNPLVSVYTNRINPTNWIIQAAFVGVSDPTFNAAIRWAPVNNPGIGFRTAAVQLSFTEQNVVTGNPLVQSFYLTDTLGSDTNYIWQTNIATFPTTFKPSNFEVSRLPSLAFLTGSSGNTALTTNLIYNTAYSNTFVTNFYSAYGVDVANVPVQLAQVPGVSLTNQPGRIEIKADTLDLSRTRMRANTYVSVSAEHLISSSNAIIDSVNMGFNLSSTNGTLKIQNLVPDAVVRLGGTMRAWSGLWTNEIGVLVTNTVDDGMGGTTNVVDTNVVEIGFEVLVVDATALQTFQQVQVLNFESRSTNTVIFDNPQVSDSFLLRGTGLDIHGSLTMVSPTRDWVAAVAPNLLYFTNSGTLFVENIAQFGTDRLGAYERFQNSGLVDVDSLQLRTRELDNSGTLSSVEDVAIDVESGKVDGGAILANGDIDISGSGIKFRNSTLSMGGTLYLSMRDNLEDGGIASPNLFSTGLGFQLLTKPGSGNLFGTEIDLTTPSFVNVVNVSAAEDRGATVAGFSDNAAMGRLFVSTGFEGLQTFAGTGISNALYVDFLNLAWTTTAAIEANMSIAPNLVIYFADSNVPAEQLDGLFGGRLQWVRDFAGPNSSVDVILPNGQTIQVNRSLRNSTTIDSDGDGIPNGLDPSPFDNLVLAAVSVVNEPAPNTVALSWKAAAGSVYDVQYASTFDSATWQTLTTYTNSASVNRSVTVYDTGASSATQQRFYRLRLRLSQ